MELFLIRHAEAESESADGSDERRALTKRGRRRFAREVRGLARLGVRFERLLFSPLLRAQETAEVAFDLVDGESEVVLELATAPDAEFVASIGARADASLALVGHEPWLSQLVTRLLVRETGPSGTPSVLHIEKGGVVHLSGEVQEGGMSLVAAYPPLVLRKLARR